MALIPASDANFDTFQTTAIAVINANPAGYGLVLGDTTDALAAQAAWVVDYPASDAAKSAAQAAVALKDTTRATFDAALRTLFAKIYAAGVAGPTELEAAGLPVRDTVRTPPPVPSTRPVMILDTSERFRHTVSFADEGTPTKKAKPKGVSGCELRRFVGATAPVDPDEFTFTAIDTRTPQIWEFDPSDGGQMGHWIARWINTRGETGPWSDVVSATVPG